MEEMQACLTVYMEQQLKVSYSYKGKCQHLTVSSVTAGLLLHGFIQPS